MPQLYIITGSNGAGKSSVGPDYIPEALRANVFDGDKLFMQKRSEYWRNGMRSHKECKKLALADVENTFDALVESALPCSNVPIGLMRATSLMMPPGIFQKNSKRQVMKYIFCF